MTRALLPLAFTVRPTVALVAAGVTFTSIVAAYYSSYGDPSSWRFQPKFARDAEGEKREREMRYRRRHAVFAFGVVFSLALGFCILLVGHA